MRIVIVEDHRLFREVLRKVCVQELRHPVVGEAGDGPAAVELIQRTKPDLVLLDLHLPGLDGFGVLAALAPARPGLRVVILSSHCDDYTVYRAERAHVHGFVDKNTNTVATLSAAVTAVGEGNTWFSPEFIRRRAARQADPHSFDKVLTDRECGVLALLGEPLSQPEIATRLGVAPETVEKHRFNIMKKLGLRGTAALVRYAQARGFTLSATGRDSRALLP